MTTGSVETRRETAEFSVAYDGLALATHQMNVRDLAPALLGLADLLQDAHAALNPGEQAVSLDITANGEGSFVVDLAILHDRVVHMLTSADSLALGQLLVYTTGAFGVLNYFRKRRRGQPEEALPNGAVRITQPDGTRIEFPAEVLTLARRPAIRSATRAVLAPLAKDGIDTMEFRPSRNAPPSLTIGKEDLPGIEEALTDGERVLITDQSFPAVLTIAGTNFQDGKKWRLDDGQGTHWMAIEDAIFQDRIDRHEVRFGKDDRLRVTMRFRQWEDDAGKVHAERSVTHVDEHIPAPVQLRTDDTDG